MHRYTTRRDREGFSVYDLWTGEIAVNTMVIQSGLSRQDAEHTAGLLNRHSSQGERKICQ
jgi:hypothetical protein